MTDLIEFEALWNDPAPLIRRTLSEKHWTQARLAREWAVNPGGYTVKSLTSIICSVLAGRRKRLSRAFLLKVINEPKSDETKGEALSSGNASGEEVGGRPVESH